MIFVLSVCYNCVLAGTEQKVGPAVVIVAVQEVIRATPPNTPTQRITKQQFVSDTVLAYIGTSNSTRQVRKGSRKSRQIDRFITEYVIPNSQYQRKKWQFASLMLLSTSETKELTSFHHKPHCLRCGRPFLNSSKTFSPDSHLFDNYIIAQPSMRKGNTTHAEKVILNNFDKLWTAYKIQNDSQIPASIILYSWIMPCVRCTNLIIKRLSHLGVPVTVIYTISWQKERADVQVNSRQRLKDMKMTVKKVDCPYRLQFKQKR